MKRNKPHFYVTAGLIWQDGSLLITKRPEGSHLAGFWEFPGGKKEANETLKECLEREIKEELGIKVKADKILLTVHHEYETQLITLYLLQCTFFKGQVKPLEGQESKWVRPLDLHKYTFPPPDLKFIEFLVSQEENGHFYNDMK